MQNKIIRIEYAGPSKRFPDKKGSVKAADGTWYDAPIGMLDALKARKGTDAEFVVEQNDKGYWAIKGWANGAASAPAQQAPQQAPQPARGPVSRSDDPTPERIYVCGIVNAAVTSQQINPADTGSLIAVTNAARQAWKATLGGNGHAPAQQRATPHTQPNGAPEPPPFDDVIPY